MSKSAEFLRDEINKRITLNLLIQGSAQHAFLTSHYLVRDELLALNRDLVRLYDQMALGCFVQYWRDEFVLLQGWPDRFWRRIAQPKHPFHKHAFLAKHGLDLALAAKDKAFERCRVKGVTRIPALFTCQLMKRMIEIALKERKHRPALVDLAKRTTSEVWGVPYEMLCGKLTNSVAFGTTSVPKTFKGIHLRSGAAGYGGVLGEESSFRIVGRAWIWPLLSHELVKGTVELICMHGLNQLDSETYHKVVTAADRIEFEPWMLQVGPEIWRRILPLLPVDRPVRELVMHMARLPARSLERLIFAVVEDKDWASELFAGLGGEWDKEDSQSGYEARGVPTTDEL